MSDFYPLAPSKAVTFVEAAGLADARRLIADFAAAGMLKSYALSIETIPVGGKVTRSPRDTTVPVEYWQRMVRDGVVDDVWTGGTVRLAPGQFVGGEPEVRITGIRFNDKHLQKLVDHQLGVIPDPMPPRKNVPGRVDSVDMEVSAAAVEELALAAPEKRSGPNVSAIPAGALVATIAQTQQATGFGRTKIYELIKEGKLASKTVGRSVRIDVASIRALLGVHA